MNDEMPLDEVVEAIFGPTEGEAGEAGTVLTHLDTQTVVVKAPALRRLLARIESLTEAGGSLAAIDADNPVAWAALPWSSPEQRQRYRYAYLTLQGTEATVEDILGAFETVPYEDSYDREMFFHFAGTKHGVEYDSLYEAWLSS